MLRGDSKDPDAKREPEDLVKDLFELGHDLSKSVDEIGQKAGVR